ncbi:MAG: hypothetical protein DAHOPDDO_03519 [Ignavibacteriaceae bacterium]|nr:hypothetical protein [Ignavibacteriaceae bacterium]
MKFNTDQDSYQSLRNIVAERTSRIVFWIGSGLSVAANLPDWTKLKDQLIRALQKKADTIDENDKQKLLANYREISGIKDPWLAFQRLKKSLGETTYREIIRELLRPAASIKIPEVYNLIWALRVGGLLNLNIDKLATRARQMYLANSALIEFSGIRVSNFFHVLQSPQSFIINLHGDYDDYSSWVFTRDELEKLRNNYAYKEFIRTVLLTSTVVFVGITADDKAVGGHLEELYKLTDNAGVHYWITNRKDLTTDTWAEKLGLRIIRYDAEKEDHSALISLFKDLLSYIPKEEEALPIKPFKANDFEFEDDSPEELIKLDSEKIRLVLNKKAKIILEDTSSEKYKKYEEFFEKYDQAIHRAWYNSDIVGQNVILGHTLNKLYTRGAFGRVYNATNPKGETVAVKILLEEERRSQNFLQSFRRGVRSMRILSNHRVKGIVEYKDATEIPALVVMEWIDGPNLDKAVKSKELNNWNLILKVTSQLTEIIENAHRVPERVLHRDLRPPNIMLKNFYDNEEPWEVVVLDFDLSWHLGASEQSILHSSSTAGYLAPEQIQKSKYSTRHSAVDSYGLGMTFFFIISARDPLPAESLHRDWERNVFEYSRNIKTTKWFSIANRFARLIIHTTKRNQSERWDVSQIKSELFRLLSANQKPEKVESAELITEEIFARTKQGKEYIWNSDKLSASIEMINGLKLCLIADESHKRIVFQINWVNRGADKVRNVHKWLEKISNKSYRLLKDSKWVIETNSKSGQSLNISGFITVSNANQHLDIIAKCIDDIITTINF